MSHVSIEHCSKTEKQNSCMGTEWLLSVLVFYLCDGVSDCELWLSATAQHHEGVCTAYPEPRKIKSQHLMCGFY